MNPMLYVDFYKPHHQDMYPDNMSLLYSNFTPRKSRIKGVNHVVVWGIQHFILEYLIKSFNEEFFNVGISKILEEYSRHIPINVKRIGELHALGYLPIEIKALPEGTLCPIGVPLLTIKNTHPDFAWLVNYLETLLSACLWQGITSATIAYEYKKLLNKYALETTGSIEGVQWQAHDFSMRGMSSIESAIISGMAHLTSFTGTDTIPGIYQLEKSYNATGLIGASVPATEHSVMCMGTKESEIETFKRLLDKYPNGILSVVSDTWDLWKVCTEYLPQLKEEILGRDGKLVIRPDSGDPADIICGTAREILKRGVGTFDHETISIDGIYMIYPENTLPKKTSYRLDGEFLTVDNWKLLNVEPTPEEKGVIELLWDVFGGTINEQGYKVLDPHIGAIYGDSITLERAEQICERLKAKGFASTNIVFGVGSYTYQYNTRDTFGFAMKATYGEITHKNSKGDIADGSKDYIVEAREIFKDPITDDGTKKSKKGLLCIIGNETGMTKDIFVVDQCTWKQEQSGLLTTIFKDSKLIKLTTLNEVREKLK